MANFFGRQILYLALTFFWIAGVLSFSLFSYEVYHLEIDEKVESLERRKVIAPSEKQQMREHLKSLDKKKWNSLSGKKKLGQSFKRKKVLSTPKGRRPASLESVSKKAKSTPVETQQSEEKDFKSLSDQVGNILGN